AAYALGMIGIGFYYSRRIKTGEDFLLGGRKINSFAAGISLFATMLSTITYLSLPGEVIKHGPVFVVGQLIGFPIVFLITSYFIIPFFMRIRITSAYEILEKPLGRGVRLTASIIFISLRFLWMGLLIFLTSKVMVVIMNWNAGYIPVLSVAIGVITLIYSSMGGLRAVVITDVAQFTLLLLGAVLTMVFITSNVGGITEWFPNTWSPNWDNLVIFSFDPFIRITLFTAILYPILWWLCTSGSDQMAIQRFISTRNTGAARRAFGMTMIAEIVVTLILTFVGFALLKYYLINPHFIPDGKNLISDSDFLFPHYIVNFLPVGITGLVVAGLLSAAMSSLSSGLNSTATVITTDFALYVKKLKQEKNNTVTFARVISIVVGILAVSLSLLMDKIPGNIIEVTAKTSNLFVAPLFNLFFMAMFVPFATPMGTITGAIYGVASAFLLAFWDVFTGRPGWSFMWILPVPLTISIFFSVLFSLLPTKGKKISVQCAWSVGLLIPLAVACVLLLT
ncbi:MAG TPA: Na+:solute symporter, partial [bacterium]|nr:Na+:solute symporter [bacterium]